MNTVAVAYCRAWCGAWQQTGRRWRRCSRRRSPSWSASAWPPRWGTASAWAPTRRGIIPAYRKGSSTWVRPRSPGQRWQLPKIACVWVFFSFFAKLSQSKIKIYLQTPQSENRVHHHQQSKRLRPKKGEIISVRGRETPALICDRCWSLWMLFSTKNKEI